MDSETTQMVTTTEADFKITEITPEVSEILIPEATKTAEVSEILLHLRIMAIMEVSEIVRHQTTIVADSEINNQLLRHHKITTVADLEMITARQTAIVEDLETVLHKLQLLRDNHPEAGLDKTIINKKTDS